ncbi:MAG: MFS transporter [Candidatus Omnitrophica bacterium]|nr:MFS transporter [Candidatus Omnitrophota bacterium]
MVSDRRLIFVSATLRAVAVGLSGVILALSLSAQGLRAGAIGLAISLGLAGCAIGTGVVTFFADRLGRRASLVSLALLMAVGGLALALTSHWLVLMGSLLLGMVNGMGRDRGAGLTVEQAILPSTTTPSRRTAVFAWYNLLIDAGHAVGSLLGGLPAVLRAQAGLPLLASYRWTWALYSLLCLSAALCAWRLSSGVEVAEPTIREPLSARTRPVVATFAGLSALDSLGGGFLTTSLMGYWFFKRFGVDEGLLGPLFFLVRILNGLSHLGAAWLARRIGLVNTMVWTHLPSSLLLMTVPIAPNLPVALGLFLIREALVEMDVPTRQSYIVAVVREAERTRAAGIANLCRSAAWAVAPAVAGSVMSSVSLSAPLVIGPSLKVAYDLLLYRAFRHIRPPEEQMRNASTNNQISITK